MGTGRKTKTFTATEKAQRRFTDNCRASARNLRKNNLAGVILGCTHTTFAECLSEQLFGLPSTHYSYVKNIEPGLPLFLFNYSDRKLHGIFEAASKGKLAINSTAWTTDGSEKTPYAAQVKIQVRMRCQPLLEHLFQPIIAANYYEPKRFWFELDQAQTEKLIYVFSSSPVVTSGTFPSKNTEKWGTANQVCDSGERSTLKFEGSTLDPSCPLSFSSVVRNMNISDGCKPQSGVGWFDSNDPNSIEERQLLSGSINKEGTLNQEQGTVYQNLSCDTSYSCVVTCPQKKWSALFKEETCSGAIKDPSVSEVNQGHFDPFNGEFDTRNVPDCWEDHIEDVEAPPNLEDVREYGEVASSKPNCEAFCSSEMTEPITSYLHLEVPRKENSLDLPREDTSSTLYHHWSSIPCLRREIVPTHNHSEIPVETPSNLEYVEEYGEVASSKPNCEAFCSSVMTEPSTTYLHLEVPRKENSLELPREDTVFKSNHYRSSFPCLRGEIVPTHNHSEAPEVQLSNLSYPELALASEMNSSSIHSIVAKLFFEVEELRLSQFKQMEKVNSLEQKLVESRVEIQQLKNKCRMLETGKSRCLQEVDFEEEKFQLVNDQPYLACDASICLVGGFDGCSWLSVLDIYFSSQDRMKTCTTMSFSRSYTSATKFNDELYILGGIDGNLCYDTVESYNPVKNQWTSHPPLSRKKGSFALLPLEDNMFVVGGGNGEECLSEVEMFLPNIGKWIPIRSLLHKRFAPAAAEIHGILYVSGGYDGNTYLKSMERLDPREHARQELESMATKRGSHSLVVLNEKLYAIGGFDGTRMISTVEVFDPRAGSWMTVDSMNNSRGYFGTVVVGDEIHVIGGLQDDKEVLDTVESFKDGEGWRVSNWSAIGKRCFFSAVLL